MSSRSIPDIVPARPEYRSADEAAADASDAIHASAFGAAHFAVPAPLGEVNRAGLAKALDARRGGGHVLAASSAPSWHDLMTGFAAMRTPVGEALAAIAAAPTHDVYVFGDYDADGVTSTTAMSLLLAELRGAPVEDPIVGLREATRSANVHAGVPERLSGYGLSPESVGAIALTRCRILICVDNGTNALAALDEAVRLGFRVVVVDHHPPSDDAKLWWSRARDGVRLLNPHFPGPLRDLLLASGTGLDTCAAAMVALVGQEVRSRLGRDARTLAAHWGATLGGLATVTDVMPLRGANRSLTSHALHACDFGEPFAPLDELVAGWCSKERVDRASEAAGHGPAVTSHFFGFYAGPRLNACGRLGRAHVALEYLMASRRDVPAAANRLHADNDTRRAAEERAWSELSALARTLAIPSDPPSLRDHVEASGALSLKPIEASSEGVDRSLIYLVPGVVVLMASSACDAGVAGLIAGRGATAFGLPCLVLSLPIPGTGECRCSGSGRVPEGSPFRALSGDLSAGHVLGRAAADFEGGGGGHAAAFGVHFHLDDNPYDAIKLAGFVAEFAAGLVGAARKGLAEGRIVPIEGLHGGAARVDLALTPDRLSSRFAGALSRLGPYGQGLAEPLVHVDFGPSRFLPLGKNGSFRVESRDGSWTCRVKGFAGSHGGGLGSPGFAPVEEGAATRGLRAVGRLRQSFFGRSRPSWSGPEPEFVIESITV